MSTTVVVPWRGGDPHRERALAWVVPRYRELGWEVVVSEAPAGPFVKALAVMPAVECADVGTVVMSDADCWSDGVGEAVEAVELGAPFAIPHDEVHRLTPEATEAVLGGAEPRSQPCEQAPYRGLEGGGIVVASREVMLSVPLDCRYVGWGQEDHSWSMALRELVGPPWRGNQPLIHLWHSHPPRSDRKRGSRESWQLYARYCQARYTPGAMEALVEEARESRHLDKSALHSLHSIG